MKRIKVSEEEAGLELSSGHERASAELMALSSGVIKGKLVFSAEGRRPLGRKCYSDVLTPPRCQSACLKLIHSCNA